MAVARVVLDLGASWSHLRCKGSKGKRVCAAAQRVQDGCVTLIPGQWPANAALRHTNFNPALGAKPLHDQPTPLFFQSGLNQACPNLVCFVPWSEKRKSDHSHGYGSLCMTLQRSPPIHKSPVDHLPLGILYLCPVAKARRDLSNFQVVPPLPPPPPPAGELSCMCCTKWQQASCSQLHDTYAPNRGFQLSNNQALFFFPGLTG